MFVCLPVVIGSGMGYSGGGGRRTRPKINVRMPDFLQIRDRTGIEFRALRCSEPPGRKGFNPTKRTKPNESEPHTVMTQHLARGLVCLDDLPAEYNARSVGG